MPDLGVLTLNEMRGNAEMIANLNRSVPLIADADTGFGGKDVKLMDRANHFAQSQIQDH